MLRIMRGQKIPLERFHEKFAVQLNDTHPAIAIAELMRLLVDEHGMTWSSAWSVTTQCFGYTNHTLLPEALERWPLALISRVLPRHVEIVFEINARFLDEVRRRFEYDDERLARMSIIDESGERYLRMAHLASVGSHAINGVAALHSELLKQDVLRGFPRFVAGQIPQHHQWGHAQALDRAGQPAPHALPMSAAIGDGWVRDLEQLRQIETFGEDSGFRREWRFIKRSVKEDLATYVRRIPASRSIRNRCSMSRSSESTSTNASISTYCTSWRCTTASSPIPTPLSSRAPSSSAARPRPATILPSS